MQMLIDFLLRLLKLENSGEYHYEFSVSPEVIRERLTANTQQAGKVFFIELFRLRFKSENKFTLMYARNRNSWRRTFYATLESGRAGTMLVGKFKVHPFTIIFTLLWLGSATGMALLVIVQSQFAPETYTSILFPIFGVALAYVGRWMSKKDEQKVLDLLDETFLGQIESKTHPDEN